MIRTSTILGLLLLAQTNVAAAGDIPLGLQTSLPLEAGGIAGVAALTLIIATQLIKRRK